MNINTTGLTIEELKDISEDISNALKKRRQEVDTQFKEKFGVKCNFPLSKKSTANTRSRILIIEFMIKNNILENNPMIMRKILEKINDDKTPIWRTSLLSMGYSNISPVSIGAVKANGSDGYYIANIEKAKDWVQLAKKMVKV